MRASEEMNNGGKLSLLQARKGVPVIALKGRYISDEGVKPDTGLEVSSFRESSPMDCAVDLATDAPWTTARLREAAARVPHQFRGKQ